MRVAESQLVEIVLKADEPGSWVGSKLYGSELPSPHNEAKYIMSRIGEGAWSLSVHGYNLGQPIVCETDNDQFGNTQLVTGVGGKAFIIGEHIIEPHRNRLGHALAITDNEAERYQASIARVERQNDLFVQMLERQKRGHWSIQTPDIQGMEGIAEVIYASPDEVSFCWTDIDSKRSTEYSPAGYLGYMSLPLMSARVVQEGPRFSIVPRDAEHELGLTVCSIGSRMVYGVLEVDYLGDVDEAELTWARDRFELAPPKPHKKVLHERVHGTDFSQNTLI